jgi:hypothetical protein
MTRYATAFKGLRIVKLKKKDKKIQDALKSVRNGKLCSSLRTYAHSSIKNADIVLLAYNSEGVVRGVAGIDERHDELYVSIICNDMGKKNRVKGYAPGRGLLDLLKKIAIRKKKDLTLVSVSSAINYYKRFGFKQHPNSNNKRNLIWPWRPSYSRARRFEYQSVNSNYNSNNNKPTIYRRTRSKVSPRASPASSNRSSASVKRTGSHRAASIAKFMVKNPRPRSPVRSKAGRSSSPKRFIPEAKSLIQGRKSLIALQKEDIKEYKGMIIGAKRSRHMFANSKEDRKEYLNLLKKLKLSGIRSKKTYKSGLKNLKSRYRKNYWK